MTLSVTLSAMLFTLPVTFSVFGYVSLVSPLSNLLVTPVTTLSIVTTSLGVQLSGIPLLSNLFFSLTELLCNYMIKMASHLASVPYACVSLDYAFVGILIAATLVLFALVFLGIAKGKIINKARAFRLASILSVILLLSSVLLHMILTRNVTTVQVMDSGRGACVALIRNDRMILIGSGGADADNKIKALIDRKQIRKFELFLLPSYESVYKTGAAGILSDRPPIQTMAPVNEDEYVKLQDSNTKVSGVDSGDITAWDDIHIQVTKNNKTYVIMITIGQTKLLIADETNNLWELPESFRTPDIFIAAGNVPKSVYGIRPRNITVAGDYKAGWEAAESLEKQGYFVTATAGQGDIIYEINQNGFQTRRDS